MAACFSMPIHEIRFIRARKSKSNAEHKSNEYAEWITFAIVRQECRTSYLKTNSKLCEIYQKESRFRRVLKNSFPKGNTLVLHLEHTGEDKHTKTGNHCQHHRNDKGRTKPPIAADGEQQGTHPQHPVTTLLERHQLTESPESHRRTKDTWEIEQEYFDADEAKSESHDGIGQKEDDAKQKEDVDNGGTLRPVLLKPNDQVCGKYADRGCDEQRKQG